MLWIALIGTISFELFGHLNNTVTDYAAYFDAAVRISAECAGLDVPDVLDVPAELPFHPKRGR